MASLIAKRLTATEAALTLGIAPQTWFNWCINKRNEGRFQEHLARIRGIYIAGNLEQMEKAANGRDGIRHDWRAADRLNGIVAQDRYGQQQLADAGRQAALPPTTINVWADLASVVSAITWGKPAPAEQVIDVDAKRITDGPTTPADAQADPGAGI